MSLAVEEPATAPCDKHPNRETALRCGKCQAPICPRCVVQTPVGARCRTCAGFRRLPQYDVRPSLWLRSVAGGVAVSLVAWYLVGFLLVPLFRFLVAFLVGLAIGEVMSRLARRRSNRWLEIAAVAVTVVGLLIVEVIQLFGMSGSLLAVYLVLPSLVLDVLLPAVVASFVAVIKLR